MRRVVLAAPSEEGLGLSNVFVASRALGIRTILHRPYSKLRVVSLTITPIASGWPYTPADSTSNKRLAPDLPNPLLSPQGYSNHEEPAQWPPPTGAVMYDSQWIGSQDG